MVNSSVVANIPDIFAGLSTQVRTREMGVALLWRSMNNFSILLRSVLLFVKSEHAAIRAVMRKTSF
jgi:hypothetical protein